MSKSSESGWTVILEEDGQLYIDHSEKKDLAQAIGEVKTRCARDRGIGEDENKDDYILQVIAAKGKVNFYDIGDIQCDE